MSKTHFQLNRPIHLAQLTVYFEKAHEKISMPLDQIGKDRMAEHVENISRLVSSAIKNGTQAARAPSSADKERDFCHLLSLIGQDLQALRALLTHEHQIEQEKGFLFRFLQQDDRTALPTAVYNQRVEESIAEIREVLNMATKPFEELKAALLGTMDESEKERYERACRLFRADLGAETAPDVLAS
ncbi:MAG: hypothetical protein AB7T27_02325 [Kiritimatiellia bacterium]